MSSLQSVQNNQPQDNQPSTKKKKTKKTKGIALVALLAGGTWLTLFFTEVVTLGGVPYSVLSKVLQDRDARAALLAMNSKALHDRMNVMGVEYDIKKYYSKSIKDPVELDQHIHQIFYDRTGYVGENYVVVKGELVPKSYDIVDEIYDCQAC